MRRVNTLVRYRYLRKRRGVEYTIFETSLLVHLHICDCWGIFWGGDLELVGPVLGGVQTHLHLAVVLLGPDQLAVLAVEQVELLEGRVEGGQHPPSREHPTLLPM